MRALELRGLVPVEIGPDARAADASDLRVRGPARRRGVLEMTRAVAALLPAGMPVSRALAAAGEIVAGPLARCIADTRSRVDRGATLAAALREQPGVFTPFYIGVIDAGEKSGDLAGAFDRLARHLEREEDLRSRIVALSIYPAMLLAVGIIATSVLMLFVLPRFVELLDNAGAGLPRATAMLVAFSAQVRSGWPAVLASAAILSIGVLALRANPGGQRFLAITLSKVPIAGTIRREIVAASFARLVGGLLTGGAPLLGALEDSRECLSDPIGKDEIERIRKRVREGTSLAQALREGSFFPSLLEQLVAVGEHSGRLPAFLLQAATILERRSEQAIERLVRLAEPAMIVLFGGVVGAVALALLQAVYGINAGAFR